MRMDHLILTWYITCMIYNSPIHQKPQIQLDAFALPPLKRPPTAAACDCQHQKSSWRPASSLRRRARKMAQAASREERWAMASGSSTGLG